MGKAETLIDEKNASPKRLQTTIKNAGKIRTKSVLGQHYNKPLFRIADSSFKWPLKIYKC
jgi:hypothetical protein